MYEAMQSDAVTGEFASPENMLRRYSEGELGRHAVMDALDIGYSELLTQLHELGLRLPTVPADRMSEMAQVVSGVPRGSK